MDQRNRVVRLGEVIGWIDEMDSDAICTQDTTCLRHDPRDPNRRDMFESRHGKVDVDALGRQSAGNCVGGGAIVDVQCSKAFERVIDMTGQRVFEGSKGAGSIDFLMKSLRAGLYVYMITDETLNTTVSGKFIAE